MLVAKDPRDAVMLTCIYRAGGFRDAGCVFEACSDAFGRDVYEDSYYSKQWGFPVGQLYAQLNHSYQRLFQDIEGKFPSNTALSSRRRPRRRKERPRGGAGRGGCAAQAAAPAEAAAGEWDDEDCSKALPFVCVKNKGRVFFKSGDC